MNRTDLLELLNGTLVDTTALVDQVAGLHRKCQLVLAAASKDRLAGEILCLP